MKVKLFFTLLCLIIATTIIFFSCSKKDSSSLNLKTKAINSSFYTLTHYNVVKEENYLYFDNFSTFETILLGLDTLNEVDLDEWENYYSGFQSFRSYWDDLEDVDMSDTFLSPLFDESLSAVLNAEGIVRVDSVAFLLDFADNSVYEVYPVNTATIDSLKNKNEINNDSMYLFKYSMDNEIFFPDDMIETPRLILSDGKYRTLSNNKRAFKFLKKWWHTITGGTFGCSDVSAKSRTDKDIVTYTDPSDECMEYRYKLKLKYQKSGLRFCVQAKAKHQKQDHCHGLGMWSKEIGSVCFDGDLNAKKFCVNNYINESHDCYYIKAIPPYPTYSTLSNTTYVSKFYSSSTKLNKYRDSGIFSVYDRFKDTVRQSEKLRIQDNW